MCRFLMKPCRPPQKIVPSPRKFTEDPLCDVQEPSERSPAILAVPRLNLLCSYAIAARLGRPVPTIDLRVDYHKTAMPGDITAKARVVRMGGQFSTAEAYLYDKEGALVASGRGTYLTAPPKHSKTAKGWRPGIAP